MRTGIGLVGQTYAIEQRECLGHDLGLRSTLNPPRPFDDVLEDGEVREEVVVLEHHRRAVAQREPLLLLHAGRGLGLRGEVDLGAAVDDDGAGIRCLEAVESTQHCGLSRTAGPDEHDDLAAVQRQVDAAEHLVVAEALAQATGGEQSL